MRSVQAGHHSVAIVVVLLVCVVSSASQESIFPCRHARQPCSLFGQSKSENGNSCEVESKNGKGPRKRLKINFGESNCTISLRGCFSGCYSFREDSYGFPFDEVERPLPSSIFSGLTVVSGAESFRWTRDGFAMHVKGGDVVLRYSTHTCAEYYAYRGREELQLCHEPIEAITVLDSGLPTDFLCTKVDND